MTSGPRPLRILHVIAAMAPRYGGPSHAVLDMGRALRARGVEVLVVATDADGPGRLDVALGRPVVHRGVPALFFRRQWSEAVKYSRPLARWLAAHVAEFDAVHVHGVFSHVCLAAAARCRARGVPYLVRPLGMLDPWSLRQHRWRKQLAWRVGARRLLREAAAVHYTSEPERDAAEGRLGLARGIVIPLGVDEGLLVDEPVRPLAAIGGTVPYVLVLGRLHPKKGLDRFIDVFLDVATRDGLGEWKLVIAGDGEAGYARDLRRRARARDGGARVVFTGWLDGPDKRSALQGAALLALPSQQENFGLAVVESLAVGVPVLISNRVGLAPDVESHRAGWVAPLEPADLAKVLEEALRSPEEREERGRAGRALVARRFAWPAIAAQLHALYASIARRP